VKTKDQVFILRFIKILQYTIDSTSSKSLYMVKTKKVNKWHLENAGSAEALADHVKCIRQLVQIAVQKQRFHSSQLKADPCIVESVIKNIEDIEMC